MEDIGLSVTSVARTRNSQQVTVAIVGCKAILQRSRCNSSQADILTKFRCVPMEKISFRPGNVLFQKALFETWERQITEMAGLRSHAFQPTLTPGHICSIIIVINVIITIIIIIITFT